MWRNSRILVVILAVAGLFAGCDDSSSNPLADPAGGLSADEMTSVAFETDLMTEEMFSDALDQIPVVAAAVVGGEDGTPGEDSPPNRTEHTFDRSRSCPAGGTMSVMGTIVHTFDPDTGVMEADSNGMRGRVDCAFVRGDVTITVNGSSEWDIFRRRLNGHPDGPQTSHFAGSWTAVSSDGRERSCEYDVTIVRDPESHTRSIDGTICGTRMRRGMGWNDRE